MEMNILGVDFMFLELDILDSPGATDRLLRD